MNWTEEQLTERDRVYRVTRANQARKPRTHPEADLQKACEDLLEYDGWRIFRIEQNYSERKRKVVGEAGAPDGMYIRYYTGGLPQAKRQDVQLCWIEWKSPQGMPSNAQRAWIAQETARGALVLLAGADFPATVDGFLEYYRKSDLMRRKI